MSYLAIKASPNPAALKGVRRESLRFLNSALAMLHLPNLFYYGGYSLPFLLPFQPEQVPCDYTRDKISNHHCSYRDPPPCLPLRSTVLISCHSRTPRLCRQGVCRRFSPGTLPIIILNQNQS